MIDAHLGDRLLLGPQRMGVWVNERAETTVPGFTPRRNGEACRTTTSGGLRERGIAGETAAGTAPRTACGPRPGGRGGEQSVRRATRRDDGLTPHEMEFKTRRLVNDYIQRQGDGELEIGRSGSPRCVTTSTARRARSA